MSAITNQATTTPGTGPQTDHTPAGNRAAGETLRASLEHEHHEIDRGIEDFVAGHGNALKARQGLTDAIAALRRHIYLEEEFLFPPLREGGMVAPIFVMLSEHGDVWRTMDALEADLSADVPLTELQSHCATLMAQLERHNAKEEPIVYSQADSGLSEDARAELHDFISTQTLPQGWVCQTA